MQGKTILVTGGAGSIGSEIVRQLVVGNKIVVIDIDETRMFDLVEELKNEGNDITGFVVDVRDKEALHFNNIRHLDYIFHCAARKHVTPMEDMPMEAVMVNIRGTYNVMKLAQKTGAKMINISTDKAATSDCVMGATKKVAELMVKNAGFVSVRFGNVMGSRGSVIPIWQKQMDEGKPLTITDTKMTRFMMTIPEAVSLVIQASQMEDVIGKTVILDMGKPVNILELAKEVLNKSDKNLGVKMIGVRPGERLHEVLMSPDEEVRAEKRDKFFVI